MSLSHITPLSDRVVLKVQDESEVTPSGIIVASKESEKPHKAQVVAVGPGRFDEDGEKRIEMSVKVGDIVLFSKYSPDEVEIEGEKYLVVREDSILGIINK